MQPAGLVQPVISYTVQVDVPGHGFVDVPEQECRMMMGHVPQHACAWGHPRAFWHPVLTGTQGDETIVRASVDE